MKAIGGLKSEVIRIPTRALSLLLVAATIKNLSNKTFLSGVVDLAEAVNDPQCSAQSFTLRLAGSLATPALSAQLARVADPVLREAKEPLDRVRSRVPGLSTALLPKRDVFGRPVTSEGGLGPGIVSPVWVSTREGDPTVQNLPDAGARIIKPSKKIDDRDLASTEYDHYQEVADDGRGARRGDDGSIARQVGICPADRSAAFGHRADWTLADLADHLRLDDGLSTRLLATALITDGKGQSAASLIIEPFGDAVIPQIPEAIGRAILRTERALATIYERAAA